MKARYLPYPSISANISLSLVPVSNMNQDAPTGEQCITWTVKVKVNGASIEIMSGAEAMLPLLGVTVCSASVCLVLNPMDILRNAASTSAQ